MSLELRGAGFAWPGGRRVLESAELALERAGPSGRVVLTDINVGLLYILAISSMGVYGVVMSGLISASEQPLAMKVSRPRLACADSAWLSPFRKRSNGAGVSSVRS